MLGISKKHYYFNKDRNIENRKYKEYSIFLRDYNYLYLSPEKDSDVVKKIPIKPINLPLTIIL